MPEASLIVCVSPAGYDWRISGENPSQNFGTFTSKETAIEKARRLAKTFRGQMIVRAKTEALDFAENYASSE